MTAEELRTEALRAAVQAWLGGLSTSGPVFTYADAEAALASADAVTS